MEQDQQSIPAAPVQPVSEASAEVNYKYAGFWIRYVAAFVDGIIVLVINVILSTILMVVLGNSPARETINFIVNLVVGFGYAIYMTSAYHATFGKQLVGIVVIPDHSGPFSKGQVL